MSRTENAFRNIFWGLLNKIVTLVLPFITRTVMIYTLGMEYVGLGSLFSSILQVLSFAELGIGEALVFSMYKPMAEGDDAKVSALLNLYKKTYRVIGIVILTFGLGIFPFLDHLVAGDVPDNINLQFIFIFYLINNLVGYFLYTYKQSLFTASQRVDVISKIGMYLQLILSFVQIIILLTARNYYIYVLVIPIITIVNNIILGILSNKAFPQYKCRGKLLVEEKKEIEKKVGGMLFQKIGGIVLTSVDTIVISYFLGLTSLALYQNYYFIITALFGFLGITMQSIISVVGNSVAMESVEKNYNDFKKFNLAYIWIVTWCTTCLLCLYQPFMRIWVGQENMLGSEMAILFTVYFFVHKWCDMVYVYQEACGIWWETKIIPFAASIINLIVNIVLVQIIGLPGILVSTIVAVFFIYNTGFARVLFRTYFRSVDNGLGKYWKRQVFYATTCMLVNTFTALICKYLPIKSSLLQLLIYGGICMIIPNIIMIFIWRNLPEYKYVRNMFVRICKKMMRKQ